MIAFFDVESSKWENNFIIESKNLEFRLAICQLYNTVKDEIIFNDVCRTKKELFDALLKYSKKHKGILRVYAHNSDFDIKFLIDEINARNLEYKIMSNGKLLSLKVFRRNKKGKPITIFDVRNTFALFPVSLKQLGEIVGSHKIEFYDYNSEITPEYIEYCKQDCAIMYAALKYLVNLYSELDFPIEIEKLNLTTPAISYKLFIARNEKYLRYDKKGRVSSNLLFYKPNVINTEFRKYYYGGRTEVFDGNVWEKVHYLDYNSFYLWGMTAHHFPVPPYMPIHESFINPTYKDDVFAMKCIIDERNMEYPIFPERIRGKLMFRACIKTHIITIEEYAYCKELGLDVKIIEYYICSAWDKIFDYLIPVYELKQYHRYKTKNKMDKMLKMVVLNATYGKLAERELKTESIMYDKRNFTDIKEWVKIHNSAKKHGQIQISEHHYLLQFEKKAFTRTNVVLAARITALCRLRLAKDIHKLVKKGIHPIYCDTDSIVIPDANLVDLEDQINEKALGWLKIEKTLYNFCAFNPKEYIFHEMGENIGGMIVYNPKQKAKGISKSDLFDYYEGGCFIARPTKITECLRRGLDATSYIVMKKKKRNFYDKRIFCDDLTTIPINPELPFTTAGNERCFLQQQENYQNKVYMDRIKMEKHTKLKKRKKPRRIKQLRLNTKQRIMNTTLQEQLLWKKAISEDKEQWIPDDYSIDPKLTFEENYQRIMDPRTYTDY